VIGIVGDIRLVHSEQALHLPGVERIVPISRPYKLASREFHPENSQFYIRDIPVGGKEIFIIAGPCSVESREQLLETARGVRRAGAHLLRGGAYKPRTSPYDFQGLGIEALEFLREAREETGLSIVTEVMSSEDIDVVSEYADMLQVGARNMQNFSLLNEVGRMNRPVMLKRGMSASLDELLNAAEYILSQGNHEVMLCERGIRTFETATRNTLDLNAVALVKRLSHLPVIVDPSHGTGHWYLVRPMAAAGLAVGADGLMIEVHPNPDHALSDGAQSLSFEAFDRLLEDLRRLAEPLGRVIG